MRANGDYGRGIVLACPIFQPPSGSETYPPARGPTGRERGRRVAASEGSMTVSVVHAQGVAWAVLAGRCLAVIPHLPCLIFGPCWKMALPLVFSRKAAFANR